MKKFLMIFCAFTVLALGVSCSEEEDEYYGSVSGTITDFDTGSPISGASVTLGPSGQTQTTGGGGHYEFFNLEPGRSYTVTVQKTGYSTDRRNFTVSVNLNTEVNIALTASAD